MAAAPAKSLDGLAAPPLATACAIQRRLESLAVTGGWFVRRVARVAADAHPQAGQLGSQDGELLTHQPIPLTQHPYLFPLRTYLLLLSQDERPGISRPRQPVVF
jgi:hypothetical protein